jgi:hypothetical protein
MKTLTAITLAACLLASTAHANIAEYCSTPNLRHNAPTQAQYAVINAVLKAASDNGRFYDRSFT